MAHFVADVRRLLGHVERWHATADLHHGRRLHRVFDWDLRFRLADDFEYTMVFDDRLAQNRRRAENVNPNRIHDATAHHDINHPFHAAVRCYPMNDEHW